MKNIRRVESIRLFLHTSLKDKDDRYTSNKRASEGFSILKHLRVAVASLTI